MKAYKYFLDIRKNKSTSLNLKFFLKSTRSSLPLKKAPPLFPSPFPLRVQGMYQPPYSVLKPLRYMVGGPSEVYASCGFLCGDGPAFTQGFDKELLARCFFRNPPVPLTLKGGSTSHLGLLPSGKKRKPLLSIVFTTPSVPLVGDRNVALNHFILWLADHQRSTPAAELRFLVRG